jgi:hypothetical protein
METSIQQDHLPQAAFQYRPGSTSVGLSQLADHPEFALSVSHSRSSVGDPALDHVGVGRGGRCAGNRVNTMSVRHPYGAPAKTRLAGDTNLPHLNPAICLNCSTL